MGYLPQTEGSQYTTKDDLDQCKKRIESAISFNQTYRLIATGPEFQIIKIEPDQFFLKQLENLFAPRITIRMKPGDGITLLDCEVGVPKSAENIMRIAAGLAMLLGIVPLWLGYGRDNPTIQQVCSTIFIGFVVAALSICFYARNRQNSEQDALRNTLTKLMIDLQAHAQEITRKPFPLKSALLFPLIIGFILVWWFGGYMYDVYKSQSWPSTQGTISESTEKLISSSNVDKYETHYVYEYTVSEQHYVS